ncbi:transglycosylase SLT domain-containing protein [Nocardioides sp. CER19]|uniref:lytic transglycosylase domain-containing protein n=1 Tax=Nocardioides sp. CER19 TaxID=3038538 RepID=UPI002447738A|nr:transglycosylase SLT domain-containing protein [Nocardioides sp. CER19]MDH2415387.1 transglycosylase SLT domain-containing protein [Nocardioides sp. CER19]
MTRRLLALATALVAVLTTACGGSAETGAWHRPESAGQTRTATVSRSATPRATRLIAPREARSVGELAVRLTAAERSSRDPATPRATAAQAGFEAQALYRQLARRPAWLPAVVRTVPPRLRPTVRLHVQARRAFRAMHVTLTRTLPSWRVVAPAPEPALLAYYREGERRFGVPWEVLAAVNLVETSMGRIRGTSVAGAQGPMQFMPATWAIYGKGDIQDPHDAILGAARYLAHNGGGRGHVDRALYAYNHSSKYVTGVKAYAAVLRADPAALRGLHDWQVLYLSRRGDVWLPEGYARRSPIRAAAYVRRYPDRLLSRSTR